VPFRQFGPTPIRLLQVERNQNSFSIVQSASYPAPRIIQHYVPVPSDAPIAFGFWYEVMNSASEVAYRGVRTDPLGVSRELYSSDGESTAPALSRYDAYDRIAYFTIALPELPGSTWLNLFSLELAQRLGQSPQRPVGTLPLG